MQSYFDHNAALGAHYSNVAGGATTSTVPLNDVQTVRPEHTNSLPSNRIGSFDFGFSATPGGDVWSASGFDQPSMTALTSHAQDVYTGVHQATLQQLENGSGLGTGLGITCDSTVFYPQTAAPQDYTIMPDAMYYNLQAMQPALKACYPPMPQQSSIPTTPQKHGHDLGLQSHSPSPPATDSRARRTSVGSGIRRVSKHRRTKSTTSLPRHAAQSTERGGFVNFTPDDSGKILSGVAPSGSSKTKARREKEAADKRRRLSQAAIKAVLEAGGDAEELVKAGFEV